MALSGNKRGAITSTITTFGGVYRPISFSVNSQSETKRGSTDIYTNKTPERYNKATTTREPNDLTTW